MLSVAASDDAHALKSFKSDADHGENSEFVSDALVVPWMDAGRHLVSLK